MGSTDPLEAYLEQHSDGFIERLVELVAQPSVSATGEGVTACAELLSSLCEASGFDETLIVETPGQPSIIARAFAGRTDDVPTLLIYGHYDVQPVDSDEWTTPPFEPVIRPGETGDDHVFGRGVSDMKAQLLAHICAVEAHTHTEGLPLDVTMFLEGEEEVGSPNIEDTVEANADLLGADFLFHPDGEMWEPGLPHLVLGDRGLILGEIGITGANRDLHSGHFGGPVPNAALIAARMCDSMIEDDGTIAIDGVYDDVRSMSPEDYRRIESATFDEDALKDRLGIRDFAPCGGDSFLEALMYHPQLNISGIHAGYGGDGNKNIVPSKATVKFDMRLVPDQDPDTVFEDVVRHVRQLDRGVAEVDIDRLEKNSRRNGPSETPLSSPFVGVVEEAVADVWGVRPNVFQRSGASGPIDVFERHLDVPHVNVPYGSPASRRHGPDENISIGYFLNGIRTSIGVMDRVSRMADAAD